MALKTTTQCKITVATFDASRFDLNTEKMISAPVESFVQSTFAGVVYAEVLRDTFCTRSPRCHLLHDGPIPVIALLERATASTFEGTRGA